LVFGEVRNLIEKFAHPLMLLRRHRFESSCPLGGRARAVFEAIRQPAPRELPIPSNRGQSCIQRLDHFLICITAEVPQFHNSRRARINGL
jgi:hypothetical protein